MEKKGDGEFCVKCGFNNNTYEAPPHHLKPGTILAGKYIAGKAIGEGGFGITYIGYDINLEIKVAIKEYFPNGFVSRDVAKTDTVTIFSGADQEVYESGREKFINEAKALAKFDNYPGIVSVKDFFYENGTAYIVMEYIEGETLKDYLGHTGGRISADGVFEMMKPLMNSLAQMHAQGIIHRDISPENIMLTKDMNVKLLDFGAARDISSGSQKSLSIQLKPGYAPEEQYRSHGKQGSWTDIYALCATMYRAMTGIVPEESLERMQNDTLMPPSQLGVNIDPIQENALMQGLAVNASQRIQDLETLCSALYNKVSVPEMGSTYEKDQQTSNNNLIIIIAVIVAAVVVCASGILIFMMNSGGINEEPEPSPSPTSTATAAPTAIPAPVMTNVTASSTRGTDSEGGQYSKEAVLSQDKNTKWVPSTSSGNGVGQWIQLSADSDQYVKGLKILNGYHKDSSTWEKNNRVKLCSVAFSDGTSRDFVLDDTMEMITLDFGGIVKTSSVRVTIGSVYYGSRWNDTAITYIGLY